MNDPTDQTDQTDQTDHLHIVHILEATAGGTMRHVRELSAALDPQRFTQTLILSPTRNPGHYADNIAPHIRVIALPMARNISPLRDCVSFFKLLRLLRELAPDIVHAHSSKAGALARLAASRLGIPCVYTPHAISFLDTTLSRLRKNAYRAIETFLARRTAAFVALSREEFHIARDTLKIPPKKIWRIPNGIHFPNVQIPKSLNVQMPSIAFIGRAAPQKGLDLFQKAAALLQARFSAFRVTTVTDAPDETVAWQASEAATVVVMPSRWEGLPYTLLDAMARGKAIVATRVGGMRDVLRDGENGLLVEPENFNAIAAACSRLLNDAPLRERLGTQAREDARAYDVATMARRHEALYESMGVRRSTS